MSGDVAELFIGPVPTIRTPHTREGEIDYDSLRAMIDFDVAAGAKVIVLTAGDSHFEAMSDAEIFELTRQTAAHLRGRAALCAADRRFDTKQAVAWAKSCRELGADIIMILPPDWAKSCSPQTLAEHYARVARELPVMMVTNLFAARGDAFALQTIELALERSANVVSIKDDLGGSVARRITAMFGDRCAVWAGGRKENHLSMAPYGRCGYLSTFLTFRPQVAHDYWQAFERNDHAIVQRIVRDIDVPFFDAILASPGGFDAAMHGILEIHGLAQRWRPHPYVSLNDAQMEALRDTLARLRLAP